MNKNCLMHAAGLCAAAGLLLSAGAMRGADSVRVIGSSSSISGKITEMTALEVTVEIAAGAPTSVAVNEIISITYEGDPSNLKSARAAVVRGSYGEALGFLEKLGSDEIARKESQQDVEFFRALCTAKLALGGQGRVADAGRLMLAFITANANSYHYLQANEVLGDLFVALGNYAKAAECYNRIAKAPWADYKMRAGVLLGRALLAQGKLDEAQKSFEGVMAAGGSGTLAQAQRMDATLGKARCLALSKQTDEAVKMAEDIIAKADAEQTELYAKAYNVLGTALRKAGKKKDALLAFLHVDVLYNQYPDAHAEALANLADLWKEENKAERAAKARQTLESQYGNSSWARGK